MKTGRLKWVASSGSISRLLRQLINGLTSLALILALGAGLRTSHALPARPAAAAALDPASISFKLVAGGLTNPLLITHAGDGSGRMFILERGGYIRLLKNGAVQSAPYLDINTLVKSTYGEQGLLALAFHPAYASNGRFYVAYTAPRAGDSTGSNLILERFTVSAGNPDLANPGSGVILLSIPHPTNSNHNGGTLAFGPDGYLYWSIGDGGGGGDLANNAQNLYTLLGKILRLDVDSASPYAIPADNPFASSPDPNVKKEIWAFGLRNPWRLSFDRQTGDLFVADVGQNLHEEVDFQPASSNGGENYGWRVMEGSFCFNPPSGCDTSGKVLPVAEYDHSLGCSVSGGYRYRGSAYPRMQGIYFYADFCSGNLFSLTGGPGTGWTAARLLDTPYSVSSFGEDEGGELYLVNYGGQVYQMQYLPPTTGITVAIAGVQQASYSVPQGTVLRQSYPGVNKGPLKIDSTNGMPIIASERVAYFDGTNWTSFSELMGLPSNQLTTSYVLPWYNNVELNTQLRFGNVGTTNTTVTIKVGGVTRGTYLLAPSQSTRVSYAGLNSGPVVISSSGGVPIIASERVAYFNGTAWTSFSELMGLPSNKLTTSYTLPWYNNVEINTQLRFGNVGTAKTIVTVRVAGVVRGTYALAPSQAARVAYPGLNSGPVKITSSGGVPIIASERVAYFDGSNWTNFSELMALPSSSLTTSYWLPYYNNVDLNTQLRFGNVGTANTIVTVKVGGMTRGTYALAPNQSTRVSYPGLNSGPVQISSSGGVPIIASERVAYFDGAAWTSFSELMGLPASQLYSSYVLPWYNNVDLNTQLRFGVP